MTNRIFINALNNVYFLPAVRLLIITICAYQCLQSIVSLSKRDFTSTALDQRSDYPSVSFSAAAIAPDKANKTAVAITTLQSLHLFGHATEEDKKRSDKKEPPILAGSNEHQANVLSSTLPLKLMGVITTTGGNGYAIIEANNDSRIIHVGQAIHESGNASLYKVLPNQILILNNGELEALYLYDGDALKNAQIHDFSHSDHVTEIAKKHKNYWINDSNAIAMLLIPSIVKNKHGRAVAYKILPGHESQDFFTLGFHEGDNITAVNGINLLETGHLKTILQVLIDSDIAEFTLIRNNQVHIVKFSFG
ncbi:MAG: hypothetical protein HRU20_30195 [Pseudomonadales bacterium]|nr:hypothetical protein [Pseudomonadales bacterium]